MSKTPLSQILELPVADRVRLAQAIWDRVSEAPQEYPLSQAERDLIDRRLEAHLGDPEAVSPWPEVKARILRGA